MGKTINQNEKRKELKKIRIITDIRVFLEILSNKLGISVCFCVRCQSICHSCQFFAGLFNFWIKIKDLG